jgi:hypothetical protein
MGDEIATLVRQEMALARAEMVEKARPAVASAGMFGAAHFSVSVPSVR